MPSLLRPKKHHAKLLDTRDGGFLSRKLLLGLALVVVIVGLGLASAWLPLLGPNLGVVTGALVGVYAIYCGANVGNKVGVAKKAAAESELQAPVEEAPPQV